MKGGKKAPVCQNSTFRFFSRLGCRNYFIGFSVNAWGFSASVLLAGGASRACRYRRNLRGSVYDN